MLLIDRYAYTNRLASFNPMVKFIFVIGALLAAVIVDNVYINLGLFIFMICLTIFVAKIPWQKYFRFIAIPIVFLIISLVPILLSFSKDNVFIWSIKIGNRYLGINYEALEKSLIITMRVLSSISSTFFLALTTPLNNIIKVLRRLKVPNILIELLVLIYRSIFIFLEESKEIIMGQEMKFGYSNMKNSYRSIALLMKCLVIRLLLRYEEMEISLDTKLYKGEF